MCRLVSTLALIFIAQTSFAQTIDAGRKFIYYERWQAAQNHFEEIIKKDPTNEDAYYWLTRVLLEKEKIADAKKLMQQRRAYLTDHPKDKKGNLDIVAEAAILYKEKDSIAARKLIDEVIDKTKSKDAAILTQIVSVQLGSRSTDYAFMLDLLEKAEKREKNDPEISLLKGDIYRWLTNGGKAVQAYEEAIARQPNNAKASYNIGKIYLTQNNVEMYLRYFNNAISMDPHFAPPYYELYYHNYYKDVNKAGEYLNTYIANVDPSIENDYYLTDLYYASSKSKEAIEKGLGLLRQEGEKAKPRLYKLIAYSYEMLGDSSKALEYIEDYFKKEVDTNYVAKDFELRSRLLAKIPGNTERVLADLEKALSMDTLSKNKIEYVSAIIGIYKKEGDKHNQAIWQGRLYQLKENPSNIDLYNWGLAHYLAGEFQQADSVFQFYSTKYPDHIHGYYWRAKSNAIIDSSMETGAAVPLYEKVVELAYADSIKNKSFLIQAYGYLGAYAANVKKDYELALHNFERILLLDPQNSDALRYSEILEKRVSTEPEK